MIDHLCQDLPCSRNCNGVVSTFPQMSLQSASLAMIIFITKLADWYLA